jgi:rubrerythrin
MAHPSHDKLNWSDLSLQDILALAIDDELEARDYYRTAAGHAGNTGTRRMLEALAVMEQGHADALRKELEELQLQQDMEAGLAD